MRSPLRCSCLGNCAGPLLVAVAAFVVIVAAIDPAGDFPKRPQGPGLTLDESYNIEEGVRLANGLWGIVVGALNWREVFGEADDLGPNAPLHYHNPDHPPLGRLCIGVVHEAVHKLDPPADNPSIFSAASARVAPAIAFALLVLLTGYVTSRWFGKAAGVIAALSLVLMPRVFGHAHLASLESFIGLAYAATVFAVADRWHRGPNPSGTLASVPIRTAVWTGAIFGLALLTKIQAVLIPIPLALWALWHWRHRAIVPLIIWSVVALAVFFALWPWLWLDPVHHFREYLGRTTGRLHVYAYYFGTRYADVDLPWHYPWVIFFTTVPLGLLLLAACGLFCGERSSFRAPIDRLLLACILFPLIVFSLPRVAVYDDERLFLVVFPLVAVFAGKGGACLFASLAKKTSRPVAVAIAGLFLAAQGWGIIATQPCYLSYYNLLVGGLPGAHRLGLDVTYWRDSVTRELLTSVEQQVPNGETVILVPVLNNPELIFLFEQSPILRRHDIHLSRWDQVPAPQRRYLLVYFREADIPPVVNELLPHAKVIAEVRRQGVQLAALYELRP